MRDYLVYVPCKQGAVVADLWGADRAYDIALNDYTGKGLTNIAAELGAATKGHKWPCIAKFMHWFEHYQAV